MQPTTPHRQHWLVLAMAIVSLILVLTMWAATSHQQSNDLDNFVTELCTGPDC